ncbi:MAG: GxxExxY protein [Chitinophagaceae bacterium]
MEQGLANRFKPISERERWLTGQIVNIAITIHKTLGPGLLESVYEKCFCYELAKRNISFEKQKLANIIYDTMIIEGGLRVDILIDDLIIVELKAQETYISLWEAQLLSYLRLTGKRLGYILNFHVPLMKDGIKRMIFN